jgi:hypothetical protein
MKEQFDKKLAEKVKASFSNHEEPFDPKQWEKFSDAYFKPRRKTWQIYWPFMTAGIAASLLFFFFYFPRQEDISNTVKSLTDTVVMDQMPYFGKDNSQQTEEITPPTPGSEAVAELDQLTTTVPSSINSTKTEIIVSERKPEIIFTTTAENVAPSFLDVFSETWSEFQAGIAKSFEQLEASEKLEEPWISENAVPMSEENAQDLVNQWKISGNENSPKTVIQTPKSFKLGLLVSPQSSSNPVSGMNLGAGIMSEISLSRKLKLDVGLAYANQSMSAQSNQVMDQMQASPGLDLKTNRNIINTDYQLNFASLDIPVNLKYKFYDKKQTGLYLITGLSSMVYLEQNTVESFQAQSLFSTNSFDGALEYAPTIQRFSNVYTPETGQSNTDVAGLLNLSFAYEYQLNKEFYISFEPFYKLPLGGLTFANQQFSIGGVNLRMNFNFKNK